MNETGPLQGDRVRFFLTAGTLAIHLAVANRYDFFRDELYFIICGRHPAFGYVDQPPLIPLLAAFSQVLGEHLFLIRAITAIAAAGATFTVVSLARLLGAKTYGALLAGTAAAIAPMMLGITTVLNTTCFDPWAWTLIAYLFVRAIRDGEARSFLWAGLVAGIDLEIKYLLPLYLVALFIAVVLGGRGHALSRWQLLAGAGIAALLAAPSLIWQLLHHFPFLEMVHNQSSGGKNVVLSPAAFIGQQMMVMNPLFAPLWIAGVVSPFLIGDLRPARYLSGAFLLTFGALLLMHAKDYYLAPLYGSMFAIGGVALEGWITGRAVRAAYYAWSIAISALAAPLSLPILSPPVLVAYLERTHLKVAPAETEKQSAIPQTFADMFGWREMAAKMTEAVQMLTPEERQHMVIYAPNYGEAAAFEFYGRDLPPVVSGHNSYYLWGLKGAHPESYIAFNLDVDWLKDKCFAARELTHFYAPWVVPFEDDSALTLCRGIHPPLEEQWPRYKHFY